MSVKPIPDGFHTVTPYLAVQGATQLMEFLKTAFDATEVNCTSIDGTIMNAEVQIGTSMVMIAEAKEGYGTMLASIYLYVEDCDAVYKKAMAAGATSIIEPMDQFYGDRSGGVKDPVGNQWWIATRKENLTQEELNKRTEEYAKKQ